MNVRQLCLLSTDFGSPLTFQHKRAAVVPLNTDFGSPLTFQHKRAAVVSFKHGFGLL